MPRPPKQAKYMAIDTETTGLQVVHGMCQPFAVSLCDDYGRTWLFRWPVDPYSRTPEVDRDDIEQLQSLIANHTLVFHNAKFDIQALNSIGFDWPEPANGDVQEFRLTPPYPARFEDTLLLAHVFHSSNPIDLKTQAKRFVNMDLEDNKRRLQKAVIRARHIAKVNGIPYAEEVEHDYWLPHYLAGYPKGFNLTMEDVASLTAPLEEYAVQDAVATMKLFLMYQELLNKNSYRSLVKCYEREKALLPVILSLEHLGVSLIHDNLIPLLAHFQETQTVTVMKLRRLLRCPDFNPQSVPQIRSAFSAYGLDIKSTDRESLLQLVSSTKDGAISSLASLLLEHRAASSGIRYLSQYREHAIGPNTPKVLNSYPHPLYRQPEPDQRPEKTPSRKSAAKKEVLETLRIHASFKQCGPASTRLACSKPNLQNVPGKDEDAELPLRRAFGPTSGRLWYAYDFQQLQIRIFAHLAGDEAVLARLKNGEDFHTIVSEKLNIDRRSAKAVNFGIIFGMGAEKLNRVTGTVGLHAAFRRQFPGLAKATKDAMDQVIRRGYVTTSFGYRLYPRDNAPHAALNYLVQGAEGDIIKNAMIEIHQFLEELANSTNWKPNSLLPAFLTLTVHDELIVDAPANWSLNNVFRIQEIMEKHGRLLGFHTPVSVSCITDNWANPVSLDRPINHC